jgi:hypothetical protein
MPTDEADQTEARNGKRQFAFDVSDRCAQSLCGLLRLLRGEPVLDTGRIGLGALLFCGRRKGKKLEPPR